MRLPRSGAGWTIAVFGLLALLLGALGLIWPETQLRLLGFEVPAERAPGDYTGTFLTASSMASWAHCRKRRSRSGGSWGMNTSSHTRSTILAQSPGPEVAWMMPAVCSMKRSDFFVQQVTGLASPLP